MELKKLKFEEFSYLTHHTGTIQNCEVDELHFDWYLGAGIQSTRAKMYMVKRNDQKLGLMLHYSIEHLGGLDPCEFLWNVAENLPKTIALKGLQCYIGKEMGCYPALEMFIPYPMEHARIREIARILDREIYQRIPEYQIYRCRRCPKNQSSQKCYDGSDCRFVRTYMSMHGDVIGVAGSNKDGYVAKCLNAQKPDKYLPWKLDLHVWPEPSFDKAQETLNRIALQNKWVLADSPEQEAEMV